MEPKTWRTEEGYTLAQLAELTGYGTSYISEVENGVKQPSLRLAKHYYKLSNGRVNLLTDFN